MPLWGECRSQAAASTSHANRISRGMAEEVGVGTSPRGLRRRRRSPRARRAASGQGAAKRMQRGSWTSGRRGLDTHQGTFRCWRLLGKKVDVVDERVGGLRTRLSWLEATSATASRTAPTLSAFRREARSCTIKLFCWGGGDATGCSPEVGQRRALIKSSGACLTTDGVEDRIPRSELRPSGARAHASTVPCDYDVVGTSGRDGEQFIGAARMMARSTALMRFRGQPLVSAASTFPSTRRLPPRQTPPPGVLRKGANIQCLRHGAQPIQARLQTGRGSTAALAQLHLVERLHRRETGVAEKCVALLSQHHTLPAATRRLISITASVNRPRPALFTSLTRPRQAGASFSTVRMPFPAECVLRSSSALRLRPPRTTRTSGLATYDDSRRHDRIVGFAAGAGRRVERDGDHRGSSSAPGTVMDVEVSLRLLQAWPSHRSATPS